MLISNIVQISNSRFHVDPYQIPQTVTTQNLVVMHLYLFVKLWEETPIFALSSNEILW